MKKLKQFRLQLFAEAVAGKKINQNDTVFMYILKSPIEQDLSPEEIAAYKALHTNYPTTTVLNDENTDMELTYTVDTQSYVDKKIAEISKAIL